MSRKRTWTNEDIKGPVRKIFDALLEHFESRIVDGDSGVATGAESPIEDILGRAVSVSFEMSSGFMRLHPCYNGEDLDKFKLLATDGHVVFAVPQFQTKRGRIDFVFYMPPFDAHGERFLAVECDGHDFHERTKDQAKKDRSRDRDLQSDGFTVYRFTGSEIWRDPLKCSQQIFDWAESVILERWREADRELSQRGDG